MTKLAPPRFVGQVMGVWFLSLALGSNLAGQLTGQYDATHLESLPALFLKIFWYGVIGGAVMLLLTPFVKSMMAGGGERPPPMQCRPPPAPAPRCGAPPQPPSCL